MIITALEIAICIETYNYRKLQDFYKIYLCMTTKKQSNYTIYNDKAILQQKSVLIQDKLTFMKYYNTKGTKFTKFLS